MFKTTSQPAGDGDRAGEQAADGRVPGRAEALAPLLRRAGRTPAVPVHPQGAPHRGREEGRHEGPRRQVVIAQERGHVHMTSATLRNV